jgi:ATP-dependent Clp protease ATP-binding subunit ClpA
VGFDGTSAAEGADQRAVEKLFSPEFRNRLDGRIAFKALSPAVMERIVEKFVEELRGQLAGRKVKVELSDQARKLLAEKGHDPTFGARPLSRVIDEVVKKPLTDQLLFGELEQGGLVRIEVEDGEIALRYA